MCPTAGTKEWTRVKTIGRSPEGRYGHAAVMVGSRFFIFGGQKDDGGFMNDLVSFDLQKRTLSTVIRFPRFCAHIVSCQSQSKQARLNGVSSSMHLDRWYPLVEPVTRRLRTAIASMCELCACSVCRVSDG